MSRGESSEPSDAANTLQLASVAEAATLATLVLVAVPFKYLADMSVATRVMGPIHGVAFLLYVWALMRAAFEGGWRAGEVARMILVACIPMAGFINQPWLRRKLRETRNGTVHV